MASLTPDAEELAAVQKRLSDVMREIDDKNKDIMNLMQAIENTSREDLELMTRSASSSRKRRTKADVIDMNDAVDDLRERLNKSELKKLRLLQKMNELKSRENELEG